MKEDDVAYIAGVVDSLGRFRVEISEDDDFKIGYKLEPYVQISRSDPQTAVFGLFEEYCSEQGVRWEIKDSGTTMLFKISDAESIERFYGPLAPYLIQQSELASIFMGEILPAYQEKDYLTKQGFYEMVELTNELYRNDPSINKWKYEPEFFSEKWRDEIEL